MGHNVTKYVRYFGVIWKCGKGKGITGGQEGKGGEEGGTGRERKEGWDRGAVAFNK